MKPHAAPRRQQSGIALLMLLTTLILVGGYAFYRSANIGFGSQQLDKKQTLSLARAKEALIARAVTDINRPGSLPCPDTSGNGNADLFIGAAAGQCPSYIGRLPWVTLDLPDLTDDTGSHLWYALSPTLRDHDSAQPINSDTPVNLRIDGGGEVAAIILAPRGALPGQIRPSNNPTDYLEGDNANGDANYVSGPASNTFNDVVAFITRQELMAAVEKRVANEIKACLEQHASSSVENPAQTYPWPAPLSNSTFKGVAQSLFGMIPATQPGGNPDEMLKKSVSDLSNLKSALGSASTATEQLAIVQQIPEIAAVARTLFDRLYIVSTDLVAKATATSSTFALINRTISPIVDNGTAFTAGSSAIPAAITSALPALDALRESLANSGFDTFLKELETQNSKLNSLIDSATASPTVESLGALQTQANLFKRETLGTVYTPNLDLENFLTNAFGSATTAANDAKAAKATPIDITLVEKSIASSAKLFAANRVLAQAIKSSRLDLEPDEVTFMASRANKALATFSSNITTETTANLLSSLESANALVTTIATGSTMVLVVRAPALSALQTAVTATKNGSNIPLIQSASTTAITNLETLAKAMENNGDNILLETLKVASKQLQTGAKVPPTTLTAGKELLATVNGIKAWADITSIYAEDIARKSRKGTSAVGDSDSSAYTSARQLLSSIDGSTGSSESLNAYIKAPSDTAKQTEAAIALAKTQSLLSDTIGAATQLDTLLESSRALAAIPTVWYGSACAFLKPPTSTSSWWAANNWANTTFYQISDRVRPTSGKLLVNGSGAYRVIAISAGKALPGPARSGRTPVDFFEGINADASRDGAAKNPAITFSSVPMSAIFNDRLAY